MAFHQSRDIHYTFAGNLHRPIYADLIDEAWRSDRLVDLDIVLPPKAFQSRITTNQDDPDAQLRVPILEQKTWNDNGV
jgi:hypothetical protein